MDDAGFVRLFAIGKEQHVRAVNARGRTAIRPAVDPGPLVAPNRAVGNPGGGIVHREALGAQQLQLGRQAAAVAADSAVVCDYAMARNVHRHGIGVQRVAHRPGGVG